jgi:hypothetical protein
MNEQRQPGFYRVKHRGEWAVWEYFHNVVSHGYVWLRPGMQTPTPEGEIEEISEMPVLMPTEVLDGFTVEIIAGGERLFLGPSDNLITLLKSTTPEIAAFLTSNRSDTYTIDVEHCELPMCSVTLAVQMAFEDIMSLITKNHFPGL